MELNKKITGNSLAIRSTFFEGNETAKAILTTTLGAANSNVTLEAKESGVIGNDISITYLDDGLETTDFNITVENSQDIICTLERKHSRAYFETKNSDVDKNIRLTAVTAGSNGNLISVALTVASGTPSLISGIVINSKEVTITTASAHGLAVGDLVGISGVTLDLLNGLFIVTSVPTTSSFTYGLLNSTTETTSYGYGLVSKGSISVSGNDITITSPQDDGGAPMLTPAGLKKMWGRNSSAKALAVMEQVSDDGDERIGFISKTYFTGGKSSAITTTALDIKREIENDAIASKLVDVFIPGGTTGMGLVSAMSKTYLSGGSNLVKVDPDDYQVSATIYDAWENVLSTITAANIARKSTGVYEFVYAPSQDYRSIYVEVSGLIDNNVVLSRQQVDLDWSISDTSSVTS